MGKHSSTVTKGPWVNLADVFHAATKPPGKHARGSAEHEAMSAAAEGPSDDRPSG